MENPKDDKSQATRFKLAARAASRGRSSAEHSTYLAEWQFIDKGKIRCNSWEKRYLLEYELAREAAALGVAYRSITTWHQLFGDQFPTTPFTSLAATTRTRLLKSAFVDPTGSRRLHDFTAEWSPLSYRADYALKETYRAQLEEIVEDVRDEENLGAGEQRLRTEIAQFRSNLPDEAYEPAVAHVEMTIYFDYSDEKIKEAFAQLLASLRRTEHRPGKKDEVDAKLRQLAAARLYRIFGTVTKAQSYLTDCDFKLPYKGNSGWTQACDAVDEMLGVRRAKTPARRRRK